jgi:hypothetical protein
MRFLREGLQPRTRAATDENAFHWSNRIPEYQNNRAAEPFLIS